MTGGAGVRVVAADVRSAGDSPAVAVDVGRWERLAVAVLDAERAEGELTLNFVDRADIAELNAEHLGVDGPTDVLSFPLDAADDAAVGPGEDVDGAGAPRLLGDVVVSPAVASGQFDTHAGTLDDELALLVVHGVLHVLGYDHAEADEAAAMRRRERELLTEHHWHGPPPPGFRQTHD